MIVLVTCLLLLFCVVKEVWTDDVSGTISVVELEALQDLYYSTEGTSWKWRDEKLFGPIWFNGTNTCATPTWQGITCDCRTSSECTIIEINLDFYSLTGTLPDSIGNFTNMTSFDVSENDIYSTLPNGIGRLKKLQNLYLSNNSITGPIPTSFYDLVNIRQLSLAFNAMNGTLSSSISALEHLTLFYVNRNRFHGTVPDALYNLKNLSLFNAHRNFFNGTISTAIGNAVQLYQLDLSFNSFVHTIPNEIGKLYKLQNFHIEHNLISGPIPEGLYNCTAMSELVLENNNLNGTISEFLGNLKKLTVLYYDYMNLTGTIPQSIGRLSDAVLIYFDNNALTGTIPSSLFNLKKLERFLLYQNYVTGPIPDNVGNATALRQLEIDTNRLNGTIPDSIGQLVNLHVLTLSYNILYGTVPESIKHMTELQVFLVQNNYLTGTFPAALYELTKLNAIYIDNNGFSGSLSESIINWKHMFTLSINNNYMNGSIPKNIVNLTETMSNFVFSNNYMTGSIPEKIGDLKLMIDFEGGHNLLTGSIPDSICNFQIQFSQFFLQYNYLTGTLPACVFKTLALYEVVVYDNMLTGTIRYNYSNNYLNDVLLYNNYFTGNVPNYTSPNVIYFEIYGNDLTGTVPRGIFEAGKYLQLALDTNHLTGTIPVEVRHIITVNYLSFYNNLMSGTLPYIGDLKSLTIFYVDNNFFTGTVNCFNSRSQNYIESVDLSNNKFTGTLPEELFQISSLNAIAVVSNCFVGSIPLVICNATSLTALALDGLHTDHSCRYDLFNGNYALEYYTPGGIPLCIFDMPNLQSLHMSGNGIGGSLPYNLSIGPKLVDIALSYNQLTGAIPYELQMRSFFNYDLSYNNFDGTLLSFTTPVPDNGSVYLRVNRLSGKIPPLLHDIENIAILNSNMFECQMDRSQLPKHDTDAVEYSCGTSSLQHSVYIFVAFAGALLSVLIVLYLHLSGRAIIKMQKLDEWIKNFNADLVAWLKVWRVKKEHKNIALLGQLLRNIRRYTLLLTCIVVIILMPTYIVLSHYYSMYQYKYAWNVSAVYLSGTEPAITLFVMYVILIVIIYLCLYRIAGGFQLVDGYTNSRATIVQVVQKRYKHWLGLIGIAIFNFTIVLGVNVAYVLASTELDPQLVTLFQVMVAAFKLIWNDMVVRNMTKHLHKFCTKNISLSLAQERIWNSRYLTFNTYTLLFNVIVIPCIATALVSSDCLYNTFVSPLNVVSSLTYETCTGFENVQEVTQILSPNCSQYSLVTVKTSYLPPYLYRYKCASTLVTTYAVIYVYNFLLAAFLPIAIVTSIRFCEYMNYQKVLELLVPHVKHRMPLGKSIRTYFFQSDRFNLQMIMYLAVFVTFGVIFPPLAVMICVAIYTQSYWVQLTLGRLIHSNNEEKKTLMSYLNQDAANTGVMFKKSVYVIGGPAAFFYAFFLFDTYGDVVGGRHALWMGITMFVFGFLCVLVYRVTVDYYTTEFEEDKIELYGRPSTMSTSLRPSTLAPFNDTMVRFSDTLATKDFSYDDFGPHSIVKKSISKKNGESSNIEAINEHESEQENEVIAEGDEEEGEGSIEDSLESGPKSSVVTKVSFAVNPVHEIVANSSGNGSVYSVNSSNGGSINSSSVNSSVGSNKIRRGSS